MGQMRVKTAILRRVVTKITSVPPTPDDAIASLGAFIRAARTARGITQMQAAREAKVSRKQLALFEKGGNVSVKFLLRLAHYLELDELPLDGRVRLAGGAFVIDTDD